MAFCKTFVHGLLAALAAACCQAAEPTATTPKLVLSADGAYVLDARAKLAWPRCVEGMRWTGKTCTGTPLRLNRADALALASTRFKADGVRWRLPRVTELQRLVDKAASPHGLDPALFPAAPDEWHWAVSSNLHTNTAVNPYNYGNIVQGRTGGDSMAVLLGWAVNLETGEARGDVAKRSELVVRLVRPQPE